MMWLTDGQTDRRTDERHTIIRPKFYFGRIKTIAITEDTVISTCTRRSERGVVINMHTFVK